MRSRVFALLSPIVLLGAAPADTAVFPDSVPGRAASAIITSLGEDHAARARLVTERFAPEIAGDRTTRILDRLAAQCRPCRVTEVRPNARGIVRTFLETPSGHRAVLSVGAPLGSDRIGLFGVDPEPSPAFDMAWTPAAGDTARAAETARHAAALAADGAFSGVVSVRRNGTTLYDAAFGFADAARTRRIAHDTRFNIGSMPKMFTAVAVAREVQGGKLRYDETLAEALPSFPNAAAAKTITVGQLLSHTSGLGDYFGPEYFAHQERYRTVDALVAAFGRAEPSGAGTFRYSNLGFVVLGAILEHLEHKPYEDVIRDAVLTPAGMTATSPAAAANDAQPLVYGDDDPLGLDARVAVTTPHYATPAGGWRSTADDLARFADALRDGKLLSDGARDALWTVHAALPGSGAAHQYGYGFAIDGSTPPMVGHNGGAEGINAMMTFAARGGLTVVVLSNLDPPAADLLGNQLVAYFSKP